MAQDQEEAVAIDIDEAVLSSIRSNISALHRNPMEPESFTIFRVPAHVRQRSTDLYEPRMVSIGPYGRCEGPVLRAMERHKWRYLQDFLSRNPYNSIEDYIAEIRELEPEARLRYFEPVELSAEEFVKMLLLDGCFVLEFIIKWGQADVDSVCTAGWSLPLVRGDLLLLENQIPLFVLEKLFEVVTFNMDSKIPSLMELLVNYLASKNVERPDEEMLASRVSCAVSVRDEAKNFRHLLHLYYRCYIRTPQTDPTETTICCTILKWLKRSKIFSSLLSYLRLKNCRAPADEKRKPNAIPSPTELEEGVKECTAPVDEKRKPNAIPSPTELEEAVKECRAPVDEKRKPNTIPSATELVEAGVTFRKKSEKKNGKQHRPVATVHEEAGVTFRKKSEKKNGKQQRPVATELEEAGVTFRKKSEKKNDEEDCPGSFLDISFKDGVLEIPFLSVENSTLSRFTNLVAFEQCGGCKREEAYMTSYATFMDCLIDTPGDVAILHQSGILENKLASDEELAVFFNQLSDCATIDYEKHYLAGLFRDVRKYCDSNWHKWRAKLVRDYFSNPWAILSLIAALVVLVLTFLQTLYSILSYDK